MLHDPSPLTCRLELCAPVSCWITVCSAGIRSGAVSGAEDTDFEGDDDQAQPQDLADLPAELQALVTAVTADQHEIPDMFNPENTQLYGEFHSGCFRHLKQS